MSAIKAALAAMLALVLVACSSDEEPAYQEKPVDTLYNAAMEELLDRSYLAAAQGFEEVERQHPYSIWAAKAQVMGAYAYFRRDMYDEAINAADRFIQLHPTSPDAPYAYYLKALAYYEQIVDVGRDQRTTGRALDALEDVVRRFPETQYARDASLKLDLTQDHLAGKEMSVGRFYLKRGELVAAINRFKAVVETHQTTTHVPEALLRLAEAYTALGLDNEARRMTAILGYNYPGTPWYADAYELVEGVEVANFPRPDERAFYKRWFDPDATIERAEHREVPELRPQLPPETQVAETSAEDAEATAPAATDGQPARLVERAPLPPAEEAAAPSAPTSGSVPDEADRQAEAARQAAAEEARAEREQAERELAERREAEKQARAAEPPPLTAAERTALAAEAESQTLSAREAAGEWRRAAAAAASDEGRKRAEANARLGDAAAEYWAAKGAVAAATAPADQAAAELQLAEASVEYWAAARDAADDELQREQAAKALAQAEEALAYWRANGRRPGWLERIFRSDT